MVDLAVPLALAILGLSRSVSWRRAGGRGRLSVLSIVLASLAIDYVALGFILFAVMVVVIVLAFGQI